VAGAARAIEEGEASARAPIGGPSETQELARAFNAMTDALEKRSGALEKAVADLRASNQRLREARAGLDRAERLASVGRLAAGVAHEVGNPMSALLAFVDLAQRDPALPGAARGLLDRAVHEGERVRAILRQLLDFSRPPRRAPARVDLARLCEETAGLVRAQRRYAGIAIEVESEGDPPPALADPDAVVQIVLNLLLNAADALSKAAATARAGEAHSEAEPSGGPPPGPGAPQPRIRVLVSPAAARWRAGEGPGATARRRRLDAVECVVADNGPGIAEEDRERIFDPFFTTKPPGEGTGLGLSNAARFAEELGGSLVLADRQGPGATFVLRLPASGGNPSGEARAASSEPLR
jgi:signal transduction histidine kinase